MARRPLTKERYDATLQAFRKEPGNYTAAAKATKQAVATTRNLWLRGWPMFPWAPPIKDALAEEMAIARRMAAEEARDRVSMGQGVPQSEVTREQERQMALRVRTEESRLVGVARGNVIGLLGVVNSCLRGGIKLADSVQKSLLKVAEKDDVDPRVGLAMFNRLAFIAKMSTDAAQKVMEMERLRMGQPQALFGLVPATDLSPQQALETLRHAQSVVERAELLGLGVVEGGGETSPAPDAPPVAVVHKAGG